MPKKQTGKIKPAGAFWQHVTLCKRYEAKTHPLAQKLWLQDASECRDEAHEQIRPAPIQTPRDHCGNRLSVLTRSVCDSSAWQAVGCFCTSAARRIRAARNRHAACSGKRARQNF